jgi:hypothetical protein
MTWGLISSIFLHTIALQQAPCHHFGTASHFPYCSDPLSQEFHLLFMGMVFEVLIEGKNGLHTKPVD